MTVSERIHPVAWLPVACLLLLTGAGAGNSASDDALLKVLRERSVPIDAETVSASVLEATVTAVDPGGRLLSVGESAPGRSTLSVVKAETWAQGLRYLKLSGLHDDAAGAVSAVIAGWATNDFTGLVLDLRSAGGDSLDAVDRIAAQFDDGDGDLYAVHDGAGALVEKRGARGGATPVVDVPLMVLIDGETRGASATLAAVIRGRCDALLLGQKSSGDNAVREVVPFSASNALYIATRWVIPGHGVQWGDDGIAPDIVVDDGDPGDGAFVAATRTGLSRPQSERARLDEELMRRVCGDAPLTRATDVLLGLRALGGAHDAAAGVPPPGGKEQDGESGEERGTSRDTSMRRAVR